MGTANEDSKKCTEDRKTNEGFYDPMAVTWLDRYSNAMDRIWSKLPNYVGSFIVTMAVFTMGASVRGKCCSIIQK
jgi:hypothetical protein